MTCVLLFLSSFYYCFFSYSKVGGGRGEKEGGSLPRPELNIEFNPIFENVIDSSIRRRNVICDCSSPSSSRTGSDIWERLTSISHPLKVDFGFQFRPRLVNEFVVIIQPHWIEYLGNVHPFKVDLALNSTLWFNQTPPGEFKLFGWFCLATSKRMESNWIFQKRRRRPGFMNSGWIWVIPWDSINEIRWRGVQARKEYIYI